jgi:hypothetical protein
VALSVESASMPRQRTKTHSTFGGEEEEISDDPKDNMIPLLKIQIYHFL